MKIERQMVAPVTPDVLFSHVDDLGDYQAWMPLIHDVEELTVGPDENPAWSVELRAQVGPFARSKRLRMERTVLVRNERAVFERHEADGREYSPWILQAEVSPAPADEAGEGDAATLTMRLSYGGSLWAGPVLERVLDDQIRRAIDRLLALVS